MDKTYRKLFHAIAAGAEQIAERVRTLDLDNKDDKGASVALSMRDDYAKLADKLDGDDEIILMKNDYAKLLVGATIMVNQLEAKIAAETKHVQGYKADIIPKLDQIIKADESEIESLAAELFKPSDT